MDALVVVRNHPLSSFLPWLPTYSVLFVHCLVDFPVPIMAILLNALSVSASELTASLVWPMYIHIVSPLHSTRRLVRHCVPDSALPSSIIPRSRRRCMYGVLYICSIALDLDPWMIPRRRRWVKLAITVLCSIEYGGTHLAHTSMYVHAIVRYGSQRI